MCGRGRSTYTVPAIQNITGARLIPRRVYGRGAGHIGRTNRPPPNQISQSSHSSLQIRSEIQVSKAQTTEKESHIESEMPAEDQEEFQPIENVSPGMAIPVIHSFQETPSSSIEKGISIMPWGLIPSYISKPTAADFFKMFNARIETVQEKKSFKDLLSCNRCAVVFNGYYEWKGLKGSKTPYYVHLSSDKPLFMAGLFNNSPFGVISCTILTCDASKALSSIHDRQPLFLSDIMMEKWLNPKNDYKQLLNDLSKLKYDDFEFVIDEVSKNISNSKYQGPDCSKPVKHFSSPSFFSKASSQQATDLNICCPICSIDISSYSQTDRENHVNDCLIEDEHKTIKRNFHSISEEAIEIKANKRQNY